MRALIESFFPILDGFSSLNKNELLFYWFRENIVRRGEKKGKI